MSSNITGAATLDEVAREMGCSKQAVHALEKRILIRLRKALEARGFGHTEAREVLDALQAKETSWERLYRG